MSDKSLSLKNSMNNVLFVLSPLQPKLLETQACAEAAAVLKEHGATRADLTMDPRLPQTSRHSVCNPMPEFTMAARTLSQILFRPVIGQSDVCDLSNAITYDIGRIKPDLITLSTVGNIFTKASGLESYNGDGRHLGFIFYLALHAKTPDRKFYNHLIFPALTSNARHTLTKFDDNLFGKEMESFGPVIDLNATRRKMRDLQAPTQAMPRSLPN